MVEAETECFNYRPECPVLHVVVVGFHHKKGCQVEYAHPPLTPGGENFSSELPSQWKHLPSLALPDGSHNYVQDTSYFHLPALHDPRKTVFGISCYRQIDVDKVKNKTDDITRGTVQKSVCVLSRLPLFGQIQVKMSLITQAYFEEGDFSKVELINETYSNLNSCLTDDLLHTSQLYVGLSARDFILHFKQRALVLFKLLLLERKVLFFKSPVEALSSHILTLLSLYPGLLESGLDEAACIVPADTPAASPEPEEEGVDIVADDNVNDTASATGDNASVTSQATNASLLPTSESLNNLSSKVKTKLSGALGYISGASHSSSVGDLSQVADETAVEAADTVAVREPDLPNFTKVSSLSLHEIGLPIRMFTAGYLCHPYLSLPFLDILTQPSIHGYVIGATNALFKAKRDLSDVLVDVDEDIMVVKDNELKRAISLTTEDLRFIDNIVKVVSNDEHNGEFFEGSSWVGGDEWIRAQFRFYLVCLLRTSLLPQEAAEMHLYNSHFTAQLRQTKFHRSWVRDPPVSVLGLVPGHPCSGAVAMSDVRLRLSHTMTNTEGGKKVSAAVSNTGRAVAGGLGAAKGALSSWWGGIKGTGVAKPSDNIPEVHNTTASIKEKTVISSDEEPNQIKE